MNECTEIRRRSVVIASGRSRGTYLGSQCKVRQYTGIQLHLYCSLSIGSGGDYLGVVCGIPGPPIVRIDCHDCLSCRLPPPLHFLLPDRVAYP